MPPTKAVYMYADTTPVILITKGDAGLEYRFAVAQSWECVWDEDEEGEVMNAKYVLSVFGQSPVLHSMRDALAQLDAMIVRLEYSIEYDQDTLDLSVQTFAELEQQVRQWESAGVDPRG